MSCKTDGIVKTTTNRNEEIRNEAPKQNKQSKFIYLLTWLPFTAVAFRDIPKKSGVLDL